MTRAFFAAAWAIVALAVGLWAVATLGRSFESISRRLDDVRSECSPR